MSEKPTIDAEFSAEAIKKKIESKTKEPSPPPVDERAMRVTAKPPPTAKRRTTAKGAREALAAVKAGEKARLAGLSARRRGIESQKRKTEKIHQQNVETAEKLRSDIKKTVYDYQKVLDDPSKYDPDTLKEFKKGFVDYSRDVNKALSELDTEIAKGETTLKSYDEFFSAIPKIEEASAKRVRQVEGYLRAVQEAGTEELRRVVRAQEIPQVTQERLDQLAALETLITEGAVERDIVDGEISYSFTKPIQYLSDREEGLAIAGGFDLPHLEESLSWKLWEEAEEIPRSKVEKFLGVPYSPKGVKQATALATAGVENILTRFLGLTKPGTLGPLDIRQEIEGEVVGRQRVNVADIERLIPNITTGEKIAARAITYGTELGLNTVTMLALGTAVGSVAGSVGTLLADALKTPVGKAGLGTKIGSLISKLPGGQAALSTLGGVAEVMKPLAGKALRVGEVAVLTGIPAYAEKKSIERMRKAGYKPIDIAGHVLVDMGGMIGFADGMKHGINVGKKIYSKVRYYKRGGTQIKAEEIVPEYVIRGEEGFPSFRGERLKPTVENYIKLAEKYAPDEMRLYAGVPSWHGSKDPFHKVFNARVGNFRGESGMFFSFGGSSHFLRLSDDAAYSLMPGLPRFGASPQFVYGEFPRIIRSNLSKKAAGGMGELLDDLSGSGTLVMPREQWGEAQAILSGGTRMVEVTNGNFWVNYKGHMIKIGRYLPQITAEGLGVNYSNASVQSLDDLMSSLSSGGVVPNYSLYLPMAYLKVPDISYPDVESVISQTYGMSSSELINWASTASPGELSVMNMILSDASTSVAYSTALNLVAPTIVSEYPDLSSKQLNLKSNVTADYGSYVSDSLTGGTTYDTPSPPPDISTPPYPGPSPTPSPAVTGVTPPTPTLELTIPKISKEIPIYPDSQYFDVRLIYFSSSETWKGRATGFREAYENAFRARKYSHRLREVLIKVVS